MIGLRHQVDTHETIELRSGNEKGFIQTAILPIDKLELYTNVKTTTCHVNNTLTEKPTYRYQQFINS